MTGDETTGPRSATAGEADLRRPSEPMVQVPLDLLEGIAQRLWAVGDDVYREQIEPLIDAARASQNDHSLPHEPRP